MSPYFSYMTTLRQPDLELIFDADGHGLEIALNASLVYLHSIAIWSYPERCHGALFG